MTTNLSISDTDPRVSVGSVMQLAPGLQSLNGPSYPPILLFVDVCNITYCKFEIEMAICADLEWAIG